MVRMISKLFSERKNFHREKHTLDFDPWTVFDELIPYVNQQIDEVEMEVNETICHWNEEITWKKNESTDIIFYVDMFQNFPGNTSTFLMLLHFQ